MNIRHLLFLLPFLIPACSHQNHNSAHHQAPHHQPVLDEIVESTDITDIKNYLNPSDSKKTLVIFDIDNTIAHPPTDLASDQWFYASAKRLQEQGASVQESFEQVLPIYFQVMNETQLVPTEPTVVPLIHELQKMGVTVIALTARSINIVYRTIEQLHDLGIDFSLNLPHEFPIPYGQGRPAIYLNGIIFVGDHDKGEVLVHWLKKTKFKPKKVIFIDDKMKNVVSVEKALHKRDFPFVGIRYGKLDDHIQHLDLNQTDRELEAFKKKYPESRPIPLNP